MEIRSEIERLKRELEEAENEARKHFERSKAEIRTLPKMALPSPSRRQVVISGTGISAIYSEFTDARQALAGFHRQAPSD